MVSTADRTADTRGAPMTTHLDRSIDDVIDAVDLARKCAREGVVGDEGQARGAERDDVAERLATIRLEVSLTRSLWDATVATDLPAILLALESLAAAGRAWGEDPAIGQCLDRLRAQRQADEVRRRIDAVTTEMRMTADRLCAAGDSGDLETARRTALRAVHLAGDALTDAVFALRHLR